MKTVVALYDQISDANATVRDLVDFGIARDSISLMASDSSGNYGSYLSGQRKDEVVSETVDSTAGGAATGAGIGALVGGLGGLLVGLGVLAIPGVGPVLAAGPLATAIAAITGAGVGAMAGGAAGGLIGALVDLGLPEETAGNYAEGVRRGGTLVTVRVEDHQAEEARRIMNRHNVVNLDERVRGWREQGWTGYTDQTQPERDVELRDRSATGIAGAGITGAGITGAGYGVNAANSGSTPYTEGTLKDHARHPEGGMFGGLNAPAEDGDRNRNAYPRSDTDYGVNATAPGSTPYSEGTNEAHTRHPEGGMFGGVNALDKDGDRNRSANSRSDTGYDVNTAGPGSTPYTEGTLEDNVRHPEGGIYGGENTPDEDGDRNRSAYTRSDSGHSDGNLNRPSAGVGKFDAGGSFDWESDTQYRNYDTGFQTHYNTTFGNRGHDYGYYRPAYYYGYQLGGDERYRGWNWQDLEPEARRDWESRGEQGTWEDFKDAVEHAWVRVKDGVRETFD